MRTALTPQEARLWARLKVLRSQGYHFRRQAPFRGYYLDFVCFKQRLVVEVDGGQHAFASGVKRDAIRDEVLRGEGFLTLRFWNNEVSANIDGVMRRILSARPHPDRCPVDPPHEGGGRPRNRTARLGPADAPEGDGCN